VHTITSKVFGMPTHKSPKMAMDSTPLHSVHPNLPKNQISLKSDNIDFLGAWRPIWKGDHFENSETFLRNFEWLPITVPSFIDKRLRLVFRTSSQLRRRKRNGAKNNKSPKLRFGRLNKTNFLVLPCSNWEGLYCFTLVCPSVTHNTVTSRNPYNVRNLRYKCK